MIRFALFALLVACGPGAPGGPLSGRMNVDEEETPAIQSNDVLAREPNTNRARVKHVLITWGELAAVYKGQQDPRGKARSREDADKLAVDLLLRVRAGDDIDKLMRDFSEDPGSSVTATSYEVTPDAQLVFEFRRMGLRLKVGEAGLVKSVYGWHVMKRTE